MKRLLYTQVASRLPPSCDLVGQVYDSLSWLSSLEICYTLAKANDDTLSLCWMRFQLTPDIYRGSGTGPIGVVSLFLAK